MCAAEVQPDLRREDRAAAPRARADRGDIAYGPRFMFYSHDAVGLGHVRRNLAIAQALTRAQPGASVLVATSVDQAGELGLGPNVDLLQLPGLRKVAGDGYEARRLPIPPDDIRRLRSDLLLSAARAFAPSVLLADRHPLGIGAELRPTLEALVETGAQAVLGLRDIVDDPAVVRAEFHARGVYKAIDTYYDEVFIYGQQEILDPRLAYGLTGDGDCSLTFCGYVVAPQTSVPHQLRRRTDEHDLPIVLATVGGGEDGSAMLEAFIEASIGAPWRAIVVAGPQAESTVRQHLERLAVEAGVEFRSFVPLLGSLLGSIDALVSMGGYNSLAEALSTGTPTVCVPRTHPRQEQAIRARTFAALGLIEVVEPEGLTAGLIRDAVGRALARSREQIASDAARVLSFDGAERASQRLLALAAAGEVRTSSHSAR